MILDDSSSSHLPFPSLIFRRCFVYPFLRNRIFPYLFLCHSRTTSINFLLAKTRQREDERNCRI